MLFGPDNFLTGLRALISGDRGILKDLPIPALAVTTTGTRSTATSGVVPADVIVLDANGEDAVVPFTVPRDYDKTTDTLKVRLLVAYASGTSLTLQPNIVAKGDLTTVPASAAGYTAPDPTTINAAFGIGVIEADLSGLGWEFEDTMAVNFAAASVTGAGVANVLGAVIEYRSTVASHDRESANGTSLR